MGTGVPTFFASNLYISGGCKEKVTIRFFFQFFISESGNCSTKLIDVAWEPGNLTSPNYPAPYSFNVSCTWVLSGADLIQLSFMSFEIGNDRLLVRFIHVWQQSA